MPPSKCGAADKVKPAASPTAEKPADIAGNISCHATYSPHFAPLEFGPEQAFYATAESVRDHLIQRWNETYLHFHKTDPKQTYYLSMEYLQGRALTNAVGNLGITGAYAEAVKKFGYELEALAAEMNWDMPEDGHDQQDSITPRGGIRIIDFSQLIVGCRQPHKDKNHVCYNTKELC